MTKILRKTTSFYFTFYLHIFLLCSSVFVFAGDADTNQQQQQQQQEKSDTAAGNESSNSDPSSSSSSSPSDIINGTELSNETMAESNFSSSYPFQFDQSWLSLFDFMYSTWDYEFKFILATGDYQCFFQLVEERTNVYISYQVVAGTDKKLDFAIRNSNGTKLSNFSHVSEGNADLLFNMSDTISICFRNRGKMGATKKIQLYLSGMSYNARKNRTDDTDNISKPSMQSIVNIIPKVFKMMEIQSGLRMRMSKDMELAKENETYVQTWAILHIILFLGTSFFQVAFVRRLFNMPFTMRPTQARA